MAGHHVACSIFGCCRIMLAANRLRLRTTRMEVAAGRQPLLGDGALEGNPTVLHESLFPGIDQVGSQIEQYSTHIFRGMRQWIIADGGPAQANFLHLHSRLLKLLADDPDAALADHVLNMNR